MMRAQELLKRSLLRAGPRLLGRRGFARLAAQLGRVAPLDLSPAAAKQLEFYPAAARVSRDAMLPRVFQTYYTEGDANQIVPNADVPWAASFVPYYRGFTNIVVYNFFRTNYGIRDPILYRYSIFSGRDAVWSRQFLLPADRVALIADPAASATALPEHASVVLEAFHPRISTPMRQLRYFVLYRDRAAGVIAGSHSLGLGREGMPKLTQPSYRGFGQRGEPYFHHSVTHPRSPLGVLELQGTGLLGKLKSEHGVVADGYLCMESASGCPTAIWHDGPTPHNVALSQSPVKVGASYAAFYVPDFKRHAPMVLVSASQIGFRPARLTVTLQREDGLPIAHKELQVAGDDATLDLQAEFAGKTVSGGVNAILEFDRDIGDFRSVPAAYVHVYYRSPSGYADQVHSHSTLGYREDPFRKPRPYRCRKFAPYIADPALDQIYSVVNLGPAMKPVGDDRIRVRIHTDRGHESVLELPLNPAGLTNIRADELFGKAHVDIAAAAIVQFEHETTNFNGSWYAHDKRSGHLATDHFTGG